jgi:hypothetical protein
MIFKGPSINIKRLLYTPVGKVIMSIVFGLGIAALFYKVCEDKSCITFRGPMIHEVDGKIIQYGEECYKNEVIAVPCETSRQQLLISSDAPSLHPSPSSTTVSSWLPIHTSSTTQAFTPTMK